MVSLVGTVVHINLLRTIGITYLQHVTTITNKSSEFISSRYKYYSNSYYGYIVLLVNMI